MKKMFKTQNTAMAGIIRPLLQPVVIPVLVLGLVMSLSLVGFASAADVDTLLNAEQQKLRAAQQSQQRVDALANQTDAMFDAYKDASRKLEGLKVYNQQVAMQLKDQQQTLDKLRESIHNVADIERQLTPLTLEMIDSLSEFIALDLPFLKAEREGRIARLRDNLNRADLSSAEKFRQVLEAYNIEREYGSRIESTTEMVMLDGTEREVNTLRVGRIAFLCQTPDKKTVAAWNSQQKQWVVLDNSEYAQAVDQGIRLARKQSALDLLKVPVVTPTIAATESKGK